MAQRSRNPEQRQKEGQILPPLWCYDAEKAMQMLNKCKWLIRKIWQQIRKTVQVQVFLFFQHKHDLQITEVAAKNQADFLNHEARVNSPNPPSAPQKLTFQS